MTCYTCRKLGHKSNECKEEALYTEGKETCLYADLLRLAEEEGIVSPNVPKETVMCVDVLDGRVTTAASFNEYPAVPEAKEEVQMVDEESTIGRMADNG